MVGKKKKTVPLAEVLAKKFMSTTILNKILTGITIRWPLTTGPASYGHMTLPYIQSLT